MVACSVNPLSRLRSFWTTQPNACGEYQACGDQCGIPGLQYIDSEEGRTIANNNWLYSLVLNILNTRAREPVVKCGAYVSGVGGHWSESYREDGLYTGTTIWSYQRQTASSISEITKMLSVQLQADMAKLVKMGVASSVDVSVTYKGSNKVEAVITVSSLLVGDSTTIALTSERVANEWVWR